MKQLPKHFKILSHDIEVVERDLTDEECDGRFLSRKNRIEIQEGLPASYRQATFWHEAMHAIATHMGMKDINDNEEVIDKLGQGVAQILATKRHK